jgi:hypothetical protein
MACRDLYDRLLVDKKQSMFYRMYVDSAEAIREHLIEKSQPSGLTYIAERRGSQNDPKMDHLACFAGSSRSPHALALVVVSGPAPHPKKKTHHLGFVATGGMYALGARHLRPEHGALPTYDQHAPLYIVA